MSYDHLIKQLDKQQITTYCQAFNLDKIGKCKLVFYLMDSILRYGDIGKPENVSLTEYWLSQYKIN